ncbi:MAG TPA: ABC transporter permease subunit [Desulfatirhabdiaceae bacterium]|nr:ABC transporter permease subunit [Desulfatirhabdiaceae bacterium]
MVEKTPWLDVFTYALLILGIGVVGFPIFYTIVAATLPLDQVARVPMPLIPGDQLLVNLKSAWIKGDMGIQLWNSFVMAVGITAGKIAVSMISAFAIVYFDFRLRAVAFASVFCTLMLPVEVRILPTYEVAANILGPVQSLVELLHIQELATWISGHDVSINLDWSLLDSYPGLILPLVASATATFLFRQFYLTIPEELCEAAKIDGASPMKFFTHILLPLSKTNIAALIVIDFVYGWNQYLWPLLITTDPKMKTAVIGLKRLIPAMDDVPDWNVALAGALIVMLPPILVVLSMQRWFVKGLVDTEK